jgi:hypothetical protein
MLVKSWEGSIWMVNMTHLVGQLGLTPSRWTSSPVPEFLIRPDILYNYFVTEEDNKAIFSIPRFTIHLSGFRSIFVYSALLEVYIVSHAPLHPCLHQPIIQQQKSLNPWISVLT